jgi:hypothetical protein
MKPYPRRAMEPTDDACPYCAAELEEWQEAQDAENDRDELPHCESGWDRVDAWLVDL